MTIDADDKGGQGDGQNQDGQGGGDAAAKAAADKAAADKAASDKAAADKAAADKSAKPGSWRDTITDAELKEFTQRFNDPVDLAKAALDLRKANGSMIRVPGKDATPEQRKAFAKAIGAPETKDGYTYELPEGKTEWTEEDKAFQGAINEIFHANNVPAEAAKSLGKAWDKLMAEADAKVAEMAKKGRQESEDALRKKWGTEFDTNTAVAKRALAAFGGDDLIHVLENATIDGTRLGDHPAILEAFAQVGRRTAEGGILPLGDQERASVQGQIDAILAKNPPGTPGYKSAAVQKELDDLYAKQGTGPVVGAQGRAT